MGSSRFFLLLVTIGLAAMCAGVDSALLTVSRARVEELVKDHTFGAQKLLTMLDDRPRYVNLLVLLRGLGETLSVLLCFLLISEVCNQCWAFLLTTIVITIIHYVLVGVGPRTLGRQHAYTYARLAAVPVTILADIFNPMSTILIMIGNALTPGKPLAHGPFASEVELRELVDLAQEGGALEPKERNMIQGVFDLGDNMARSVMVPRTEMVWIEHDKSVSQALSLAVRSGFSRIPVIGADVDDILGVLYVKDVLAQVLQSGVPFNAVVTPLSDLVRPAQFLPDIKPLDEVLALMQKTRTQLALLVNEYGSIAGLVTMEDIVEEIVGEITDEYDFHEQAPIQELADGSYRVSARLSLADLGELFNIDLETVANEEVTTVGGLLSLRLGRVPLPGAIVHSDGLVFYTEGGKDRRGRTKVATLRVTRAPEESQVKEGAHE